MSMNHSSKFHHWRALLFSHVAVLFVLIHFTGCDYTRTENQSNSMAIPEPVMQPSPFQVSDGYLYRIQDYPSNHITPRHVDIWLPDSYVPETMDLGGGTHATNGTDSVGGMDSAGGTDSTNGTDSAGGTDSANHADPATRYAVIYMHDGQMLFDGATTWNGQEWGVDETLTQLMKDGKIPPVMVVGVWSNPDTRHSDYFPQKPFEAMSTAEKERVMNAVRDQNSRLFSTEIASDGYLRFLTQELKPFIDTHFPTKPGRESTFTMGASMGGLISMYALAEYPDIFGGFGAVSTHWPGIFEMENNPVPGAFLDYMGKTLPAPGTHRLYFDFGTETLDAIYEPHQNRVDALVSNLGYNETNWMTRKFEGKDHSEDSWSERFHIPVTFLLAEPQKSD